MDQETEPHNAIAAETLQSIPAVDTHFLAECLVKSALTRPAPSSVGVAKSYECDICGKTFSSYHALGGHKSKSSHNINKRTRDEAPVKNKSRKRPRCLQFFPAPTTSSKTETASSSLDEEQVASSSRGPYECDVCGKTFSVYQALGGHKSSHFYNNIARTHHPTKIVKSHKRPPYLQLFPESPGQATSTSTSYKTHTASSCTQEPGEIDLELRLGSMI